jgi:hypothetical protein
MKNLILILAISCVIIAGMRMKSFSADLMNLHSVFVDSSGQDTTRYLYLGAEACATKCHNGEELGHQYDAWTRSRHSKSYESLTSEKALLYSGKAGMGEKPWESMICLKCHTTAAGFDQASLSGTYKKEDGVTCEACHKSEFIPKTFLPEEADCLKCHNNSVHEVSLFDFRERCLRISHPRTKMKQE